MSTPTGELPRLFRDRRLNAALGWAFVAFMVLVGAGELLVGDLLSAGFTFTVVVLAVMPPVQRRNLTVMLPWEVIGIASLPTVVRALATWPVAAELGTYLAVAALALMVAVELHAFTSVKMTYAFAVLFVVVTTMATAGVWAVVRWLADIQLGTGFLESEEELMWEFVYSTAAGVLAGGVFRAYFGREAFAGRIPDHDADPEAVPATSAVADDATATDGDGS
ncbi:hypothetical protein BRD00_04975 [Halobacteriales archaeon QS_8_69_26]|nr:MAG: hypothetical protein BRD00_04975 [Halobacteriales archaeon QS_8_69_26]